MKVEYINPFIESTLSSLEMMAQITAERDNLGLKENLITTYDISSIIALTGEVQGSVILSFPTKVACQIASRMLMEEKKSMDKDVEDAIGEIGNIIVGNARRQLMAAGYKVNISIPSVVIGEGHKISRKEGVPCIGISFKTAEGPFEINVGVK